MEVVEGLVVDVEGLVDVEDLVDAEDLVDVEDWWTRWWGRFQRWPRWRWWGDFRGGPRWEVVDVDSEVISYVDHQKIMMELDESTDFNKNENAMYLPSPIHKLYLEYILEIYMLKRLHLHRIISIE